MAAGADPREVRAYWRPMLSALQHDDANIEIRTLLDAPAHPATHLLRRWGC